MSQLNIQANDYTLTFTLKQHTPLIHFQAEQKGATLRATELKPKLDRFLITKLGGGDYNAGVGIAKQRKWLIGKGEHPALDYKVRIEPNKEDYDSNDRNLKNYFGNQGAKSKKYAKNFSGNFQLTIICFNNEIKKNITENIAEFFALHNFGTRQSKGYGSFYLDEKSNGYKSIESVLPNNTVYLEINTTNPIAIDEVIKYFWQRLKSGINKNFNTVKPTQSFSQRKQRCKNEYKKAFIQTKYPKWDKSWIKQTFFIGNEPQGHEFVRALLGLPSSFSYKRTNEPCRPSEQYLTIEDDYTISVFHQDISRIPSPLIFKPITANNKTRIFLIVNDKHLNQIYSKDFQFRKHFIFNFDFQRDNKTSEIIKDRQGYPKLKTKEFPPFNSKAPNKYYDIPDNFLSTRNRNVEEGFSFQKQYERFEDFLRSYCEQNPNNNRQYRCKVFTLYVPKSFNFSQILEDYINELKNSFNVEIKTKAKIENIKCEIKRIKS